MILHIFYNNIHRSLSMMSMYKQTTNPNKFLSTIILLN